LTTYLQIFLLDELPEYVLNTLVDEVLLILGAVVNTSREKLQNVNDLSLILTLHEAFEHFNNLVEVLEFPELVLDDLVLKAECGEQVKHLVEDLPVLSVILAVLEEVVYELKALFLALKFLKQLQVLLVLHYCHRQQLQRQRQYVVIDIRLRVQRYVPS